MGKAGIFLAFLAIALAGCAAKTADDIKSSFNPRSFVVPRAMMPTHESITAGLSGCVGDGNVVSRADEGGGFSKIFFVMGPQRSVAVVAELKRRDAMETEVTLYGVSDRPNDGALLMYKNWANGGSGCD